MKTFYIAGPMRGKPFYNFPNFDAAKTWLELKGYSAVSPADLDRAEGFDEKAFPKDWDWSNVPEDFEMKDAVLRDVDAIVNCDGVVLLDGWNLSKGASAEAHVAIWLGLPVYVIKNGELREIKISGMYLEEAEVPAEVA